MDSVLQREVRMFAAGFPDSLRKRITGKVFLITGLTGLIGSTLARCLLSLQCGIRIVAPVRNRSKALSLFGADEDIQILEAELTNLDFTQLGKIDYIVHAAAPTASRFFVDSPVETISSIIDPTDRLLRYAATYPIEGFVYLSSIEVYGAIDEAQPIAEDEQGFLNPLDIRSSYPMAKRMAETLCCAYAKEYGVPVRVARLTQTTGPGIAKDDNRVIAQFVRAAVKGEDIVLHTTGESARSYCHTIDTIEGILYILLCGTDGAAYNVAQEESFVSARQLAEVIRDCLNPEISVRVELKDNMGYAPLSRINLSTQALRELGWTPKYNLKSLIINLAEYLTTDGEKE